MLSWIRKRELLPPFAHAAVPAFPGWRAALGPGIVWMALAQGSGELVWWPYLVAKYGLGFVFLLVPACLLQWPLTFEIGRYTLLTGESIWRGFVRLHPAFALPLWLLMTLSFLWFGAFASAGGTALAALTHFPGGWSVAARAWFWGYLAIALLLGGLVLSPVLYRFIEKFMLVVALFTLIGLIVACAHPTVWQRVPDFLLGLVRPERPLPRPWERADAPQLLTGITFAGLGGFWTLFYSYWLREKGAGMAAHATHVTGLLRAAEPARAGATLPSSDPASAPTLRRWLRFLLVDSGIGIFGNIVTTLLTCLLAYALLTPQGLLPQGWDLAVVQSRFFGLRWGPAGEALFLLVAAAFLADTWLSTVDAVSRVHTDLLESFFPSARRRSSRFWYFVFLFALTVVTCATMPLGQPGPLIIISALTGFVGTVFFTFGVLALNHRFLPPALPIWARPRRRAAVVLGLVACAYVVLAAAYLWLELA